MPNGCQVRATNTTSGQTRLTPRDWNHEASYQMTDEGAWTWTADSPGCRVTERRQPSPSSLPYVRPPGAGDTDPLDVDGSTPVSVEIIDAGGQPHCDLTLVSVADGRTLAFERQVPTNGPPVTLDPGGVSPVYVREPTCGLRVTQG
jgi:hypothetical protein